MSELRKAVLAVDVIGNALRDIKDIRKEWEELKSRGIAPIDLKVNVSQTGQTLSKQVQDASKSYETLANTASAFHAQTIQAMRPSISAVISPTMDVSAYKKILSSTESVLGSTKIAIPGVLSQLSAPRHWCLFAAYC